MILSKHLSLVIKKQYPLKGGGKFLSRIIKYSGKILDIDMDNEKIEIDKNTIEKLFKAAGLDVPGNISNEQIQFAVEKLKAVNAGSSKDNKDNQVAIPDVNEYLEGGEERKSSRTVLIIDDLGVIVYQLELLFKKMGFEVTTTSRVNDCINQFKKKDFGYVIMDLFLPTEKEGFLLLDELKKLVLLCKLDTKIVVMTASSKGEFKLNCKNRGADFYIEKTPGWQKELIDYCK